MIAPFNSPDNDAVLSLDPAHERVLAYARNEEEKSLQGNAQQDLDEDDKASTDA